MTDAPPDFTGDLDGFLRWSEENGRWNPDWCPRHWAPCPVEGKNGLVASVLIMQVGAFRDVPKDVAVGPALNSWRENQTTPTCCRTMGDEEMARLWELVDVLAAGDVEKTNTLKRHFGLPSDKPPFAVRPEP